MKKLRRYLRRKFRILSAAGLRGFLRYHATAPGDVVSLEIHGHALSVRRDTPDVFVAIAALGGEYGVLAGLFPQDFDGVIVDAGGFIGVSARAMAALYPRATIVVIEPAPDNFAMLERNTQGLPNLHLVQGVLAAEGTEAPKLYDPGHGEWGYSIVEANPNAVQNTEIGQVALTTLDGLKERFGRVDILKLDIEGAEKQLFEAEGDALATIPVIVAELHEPIAPGCEAAYQAFAQAHKDRVETRSGEKVISRQSGL